MVFLLLLRRPRVRLIAGGAVLVAGLTLVGVSAVVAGVLSHGIDLAVIGTDLCVSGIAGCPCAGTLCVVAKGAGE